MLIFVRLNEDVEDIRSVWELFKKVNNICGEVEVCFEFFIILNEDVVFVDFFGVFIISLNKLFGFIVVFNKF